MRPPETPARRPTDAPPPLTVNMFLHGLRADPFRLYERLREESPIRWVPFGDLGGYWLVSRHRDVTDVLRSPAFSAGSPHLGLQAEMLASEGVTSALPDVSRGWLMFKDGPEHRLLRSAVAPAFTQAAAEARAPRIESIVDELVGRLGPDGTIDVIGELAMPLPVRVIGDVFGFPDHDSETLARWSLALGRTMDPFVTARVLRRASVALDEWLDYFDRQFAERRRKPSDDLLSHLLTGTFEGRRLTEDEIRSTVVLVFLAGHETLAALIGNCVMLLAEDPELAAELRRDRTLIAPFVEETLRLEGPIQMVMRVANRDASVGTETIRRGQQVMLLIGSANRDSEQYDRPDQLVPGRRSGHVAFGRGSHYCIGAGLARLEAAILLDRLLDAFPVLRLAGPGRRLLSFTGRLFRSLPVQYRRALEDAT